MYNVKVGENFLVILSSNPSTGYDWFLKPIDENYLQLIEKDFTNDIITKEKLGMTGKTTFLFKCKKKIQMLKLVFGYRRPWESQNIKERIYIISII